MAGKNTSVFGIYPTYSDVESGVDALKTAGFRNTDISVLFPENVGSKDFAHEKNTKAPEGATAGAGTGVVLEAPWDGWWALELWPYLDLGHSSRLDRSWLHSLVLGSEAQWEG